MPSHHCALSRKPAAPPYLALVVCAVLLGLTSCAEPLIRPNLILIALERTRVDHLGAYSGADPSRTQVFDFIAQSGLLFTNAYTTTTNPAEATIDLLSGGLGESGPLLPEILQGEGYVTIGSLNERGAADPRLKVGFEELDDTGGTHEERAKRLFDMITSHATDGKPIFIYYQAPIIEAPYANAMESTDAGLLEAPDADFESLRARLSADGAIEEGVAAQLAELYAMELDRMQGVLFQVLRPLRRWGIFENYMSVITALSGEELGEHGRYSPADSLYQEMLHIPFVIATEVPTQGARSAELATLRDVAPTLLGYAAIEAPDGMTGRDLRDPELVSAEAIHSRAGEMRAVVTDIWKLIESGGGEEVRLYNLVDDPGEETNVAAENPEVVERLRAQ